ncbi:MAG: LarC family nickel insertion protein [Peptoniphilaceae bacterium]|nr:LarC family nickel insertion protein [Peptoniphilaceae bacterium]MDY3737976.1 LarC family nickel insertion protein [Peptoniphilaceae bacterium]
MDLYFEMYSGISGDMTIASLLDLGASKEKLIEGLKSIDFGKYELIFDRKIKNGIDSNYFEVIINENKDHHEDNIHDNHHFHRNLFEIEKIIDSGSFNEKVKGNAKKIFKIIAKAESKAHGIDISEVHFHEVGAIDSIIDIIGVSILMDDLNPDNVYFSDFYEAKGYINIAHGPMPLPTPATLNIITDNDFNLNLIDDFGERNTPTGAAIVANYATGKLDFPFKVKRVGIGAGKNNFKKTNNILRVMEIEKKK